MCISVGAFSTLFYSFNIKEKPLTLAATELEAEYRKTLNVPSNTLEINNISSNLSVISDNSGLAKQQDEAIAEELKKKSGKQWRDWLAEPQFYIFALVYMFARIALNSTATMMPLYLTSVTGFVEVPG
jgi:Na+/melibiose symporter-like transporter